MQAKGKAPRNLLDVLLGLGLVEQVGERRGNRVYYAPRLLQMLQEAAVAGDSTDTRSSW